MKPIAVGPCLEAFRVIEVEEPDILIENCQISGCRTGVRGSLKYHGEKARS